MINYIHAFQFGQTFVVQPHVKYIL